MTTIMLLPRGGNMVYRAGDRRRRNGSVSAASDFRKRHATRRQIGRPDRGGWRSPAAVSLLTRFPRVRPTHIL